MIIFNLILFSPDIFILDDPTSSLDNTVSHQVMKSIKEDWDEKTFIITTNNFGLLSYFDRVIMIDNGKIIHFGTPEEIKKTKEFTQISIKNETKDEEVRDLNLTNF